jgi:catechol 2,3-dioxygenase-like lactoylglutathione lyase family enzyme
VSLSVRNLDESLSFYSGRLGLPVLAPTFEGTAFEGREAMVLAGVTALCLQEHRSNRGEDFDPLQTGLDHIALAVNSLEDLQHFAAHLDDLGIANSGVKPLTAFGHFIELRDPDGILVEIQAL